MPPVTIYSARRIVTMQPHRPEATHVAVRDGRVLGVGDLTDLEGWGEYRLDQRFSDKVLVPGFVEGHAHVMEGTLWRHVYCGWFDRTDPRGRVWNGLKSMDDVIGRLKEAEGKLSAPHMPLAGFQLDPIYMNNRRVTREDLDVVSTTRPVGVLHASGHIMNVNSRALELSGLLKEGVNHPGIPLGPDGLPTGEIRGPDVMSIASPHVGFGDSFTDADTRGLHDFARLCVRSGVTTVTDLAARLAPPTVSMMLRETAANDFPVRMVPLKFFLGLSPEELVVSAVELQAQSTERLRLGRIKIVADGSIQGFSARLRWPGYYNGAPQGLWYIAPEQMGMIFEHALKAGIQVHVHTNGDQATDLVLDQLGQALLRYPRRDHRFTMQHCQMADRAQFRRMQALGMCVNLFANHHFFWGDEHYRLTVGPDRAMRMNACRSALDCGVPMAIHSDAPVTPLGPLFTAWAAVTRRTASGRVQGKHERISVNAALAAITSGAAYTLHLDGETGTIETGKAADFAVLEEDPREVDPHELKEVPVWGTVQGGRIFAAAEI